MSVNQMAIYHIIIEVFNILYNKSSEQISNKYIHHDRHSFRKNTNNFLRVPEIHEHRKCTGFTVSQSTSEKHRTASLSRN